MKELKELRTDLTESSLKKYDKLQKLYESKLLGEESENGYIAFYKGKQEEVYAKTSYEAQKKATEIFKKKFPKIKSYDVTVKLAEKDGKQVTHTADF